MISWGTNYDEIGLYSTGQNEVCKICANSSIQNYKVERGYFKLYGLALLPTGKKYYKTCSNCNTRLKVKSNDDIINILNREIASPLKLKYIWGWLVLGPIIVGILYLFLTFK